MNWEADIVLADGGVAHLRPVEPADRERFIEFYDRVSDASKYLRFFSAHPTLGEDDLDRWVNVDNYDRVTLVITERERIIATARYEIVQQFLPARVGDVSFLVQDEHHGRGAANILLEHLAQIGRECGVERFFAEMLTQNRSMVQVFVRAGYLVKPELEDGFITVDFPIDPTRRSKEVMLQREHRAEASAIRRLLEPRHVAVVGDVEEMRSIVAGVVGSGFRGELHVVTSVGEEGGAAASEGAASEGSVGSSAASLLRGLPGTVDLVVVAYHKEALDEILSAAAAKEARGLVVVAQGGSPGLSSEEIREFVEKARSYGLRAFGPASLGVINADPKVRLNASPAPMPRPGSVGLFTQSAGVATLALARAIERRCGLSTFIATGAFADITANDVIQFWAEDADTQICLLSLDAIGNPRKFFRVLRRLALEKHVVVFTPSRALGTARHYRLPGLVSAPAGALDEVISRSGAMVVQRRDTMFDIAQILARQPLPRGRKVALIANSKGLLTQMHQAALRFDLEPDPRMSHGSTLAEATREALADPGAHAVLVAVVDIRGEHTQNYYEQLSALADSATRATNTARNTPLIASFVGFKQPLTFGARNPESSEQQGELPIFATYADALEAISLIRRNEEMRAAARPNPEELEESSQGAGAQGAVEGKPGVGAQGVGTQAQQARAMEAQRHDLREEKVLRMVEAMGVSEARAASDEECAAILAAYGIDLVPWVPVATLEEATEAAEGMGWGVVLKALSPVVRGRPELSAVVRHIGDANTMHQAWASLGRIAMELGVADEPDPSVLQPVIQATVPAGASLSMRAIEDPVLGPMVSVGASGLASDLVGDRAWRVPPLRRSDTTAMLEQLAAAPILHGYRGATPSRLDSIEDLLIKLAQLKDDIAALVEIELTPVVASADNTHVVGARMRVAPLSTERDPLARGLSAT